MNIVTWNAERMFSHGGGNNRATPEDAIETLRTLDADIVAIPEFAFKTTLKDSTLHSISSLGYTIVTAEYIDERASGLLFAVLSRVNIESSTTHRFDNSERFAVELNVIYNDKTLSIFATHLDDRSETQRRGEARWITDLVAKRTGESILLGDMNAMIGSSWRARLLRLPFMRALARLSPSRDGYSIGSRLIEMADGGTIATILSGTGLVNATSLHPTISAKQIGLEWAPSIALVKIDWIFVSSGLEVDSYSVSRDVGSDHRPLFVKIK